MNEIILITGAYGMVGQNTALYFKKISLMLLYSPLKEANCICWIKTTFKPI